MARVLIAVDGSELSTSAALQGVKLLGPDHDYTILHVVPPSLAVESPLGTAAPLGSLPVNDEIDSTDEVLAHIGAAEIEAHDTVDLIREQLQVDSRGRVEIGSPGEEICRVAKEIAASVLVIGGHERRISRHLFLGSASGYVLEHAPCFVLVLGRSALEQANQPS